MEKFIVVIFLLLFTAAMTSADDDTDIRSVRTDAITRAEQTLQGLFHYYWRSDPIHPKDNISFFFACAQVGGIGSVADYQCSCGNPDLCVNCYRWYDAVTLESLATYGIYMNTTNNSEVADIMFAHSPYNAKWNAKAACIWIDDFSWYGLAYLRVYEWLKDPKWLLRSLELFDWVWDNGWDEPCGGFWWSNCWWVMYKDSITNMEALHYASKLAYMFPEEDGYLNRAVRLWNWLFTFDGGYGLMSDQFMVSTGAVPEKCCNATSAGNTTKCYNTRVHGTSYNQGILISSAAYLYLRTGDKTYLNVGLRAVEAIITNYTTKDGVLIDEPRSWQSYQGYQCIAGQDPGGDWYSFNGIFMLHLSYFVDLLHKNGSLPDDTLKGIFSLVNKTSNAAWNRSALWPPFKQSDDVCNVDVSQLSPNISLPKFHWWWGENVTQQITAPDPRIFIHRLQLRCTSLDNSQIWEGEVTSELECTNKCRDNPLCSKYLYTDSGDFTGINCWSWGYNRSTHNCSVNAYNWYVGIKRPLGNATCAGRCGSKEPQRLDHGVCYCDADCANHLDCCTDYANHCSKDSSPPSCKGLCEKVVAQPLPGGGYCWCDTGCNPWMTDNNSDGSCCIDYPVECSQLKMPPCLDARSQGSAFNLFLAHLKLTQVTD